MCGLLHCKDPFPLPTNQDRAYGSGFAVQVLRFQGLVASEGTAFGRRSLKACLSSSIAYGFRIRV